MKKNKLTIYYEDKHLLICYKDAHIPTINDNKHSNSLYSMVFDYLHKKNQRVFIVHRLDMDTSGIVVFAKSEKVKNILQESWDKVNREYLAIVHGKTKEKDIIESYLKETKTLYTYSTTKNNGKYSKTEYELLYYKDNKSLINIKIYTGRKNQIRVHMKDNNTPILGDKKYGIKDGYRKMMLLAYKISFIHPITKEEVLIELPIPEDFKRIIGYDK